MLFQAYWAKVVLLSLSLVYSENIEMIFVILPFTPNPTKQYSQVAQSFNLLKVFILL